jgi:streptogramin lyase
MPSNNSNGLALDGAGKLVAAEHGSRSVTRDGAAIATVFETKKLNSPNDVIVAGDGTIYFTDPPYGIPSGQTQELAFNGVFRIAPNGTLTAEHMGPTSSRPNGIGLSPDGKTLYVADTADGNLYRFTVGTDGALSNRTVHAMTSGGPDGLAIDSGGNIFVTTSVGVEGFCGLFSCRRSVEVTFFGVSSLKSSRNWSSRNFGVRGRRSMRASWPSSVLCPVSKIMYVPSGLQDTVLLPLFARKLTGCVLPAASTGAT